jgi:hypothetical protein
MIAFSFDPHSPFDKPKTIKYIEYNFCWHYVDSRSCKNAFSGPTWYLLDLFLPFILRRAALSIWHQLTQSIQKGESSFQEKCMDFHEIHPRVAYDLAHVCISWSVHITFCVDIISYDSPFWILCVSWCQIERAARLRLRLGNLLHLHAIRDSKTWNDSDKTSMTGVAYDLAHVCISWSVHITFCVDIISFLLEFSFKFIWIFQNINNKRFQDFSTLQ